ncbi:hypothetical protein Ciccas_009881 [Cichlidogyrus casuarinus]|uniref:Uncharacterized protein n=1 Tax=Cichlidogyrus casuarinus TaxID=1844966 RepID=A0ABD2PWR2_9PLAT
MGSNFLNYFMLNALFCPVPAKCMLDFMKDPNSTHKSADVLTNDLNTSLDAFLEKPSMLIFHRLCLACAAVLSNQKISFSQLTDLLENVMKKCGDFIDENQDIELLMDPSEPLNMVKKDAAIVSFVDLLRGTYQIWNEMKTRVEKLAPERQNSSVEVELTVVLEAIDRYIVEADKLFFMALVLINLGSMVFFLKQQVSDLDTILKSIFMSFCFLLVETNSCVVTNHIRSPQSDILLRRNMKKKLATYENSRDENHLSPFLVAVYQYATNGHLQKQKLKNSTDSLCCLQWKKFWIHDGKKRNKTLKDIVQRLLKNHPDATISSNSQIEINAARLRKDYLTASSIFQLSVLSNMANYDDMMHSENKQQFFIKRLKLLIINLNLFISILPEIMK